MAESSNWKEIPLETKRKYFINKEGVVRCIDDGSTLKSFMKAGLRRCRLLISTGDRKIYRLDYLVLLAFSPTEHPVTERSVVNSSLDKKLINLNNLSWRIDNKSTQVDPSEEIWKPILIPGLHEYSVSNKGRVKRHNYGLMIPRVIGRRLWIHFQNGDVKKPYSVGYLVLCAFRGMPEKGKEKVHFIDGNRFNVKLDNLAWSNKNQHYGSEYLFNEEAAANSEEYRLAVRLCDDIKKYALRFSPIPKTLIQSLEKISKPISK